MSSSRATPTASRIAGSKALYRRVSGRTLDDEQAGTGDYGRRGARRAAGRRSSRSSPATTSSGTGFMDDPRGRRRRGRHRRRVRSTAGTRGARGRTRSRSSTTTSRSEVEPPERRRRARSRTSTGSFGSVSWFLMLAERTDPVTALTAVDGWGGDSVPCLPRGRAHVRRQLRFVGEDADADDVDGGRPHQLGRRDAGRGGCHGRTRRRPWSTLVTCDPGTDAGAPRGRRADRGTTISLVSDALEPRGRRPRRAGTPRPIRPAASPSGIDREPRLRDPDHPSDELDSGATGAGGARLGQRPCRARAGIGASGTVRAACSDRGAVLLAVVLALVAVGVAAVLQRRQRPRRADPHRLRGAGPGRPGRLRPPGRAVARRRVHLGHVQLVRRGVGAGAAARQRRRRGAGARARPRPGAARPLRDRRGARHARGRRRRAWWWPASSAR